MYFFVTKFVRLSKNSLKIPKVVMGIGHIFKIDDRYTNIDLLNVFTDYNYSDSIYFMSMLDKSKDFYKL
jgi:hypothetical protein